MSIAQQKNVGRLSRHARVRRKIIGTEARPRLAVFRSNRYLYAQVICDKSGRTLAAASTLGAKVTGNMQAAQDLGKAIAERCKELSITTVVFDRAGYKYHGRVKAVAEAAREAGLAF